MCSRILSCFQSCFQGAFQSWKQYNNRPSVESTGEKPADVESGTLRPKIQKGHSPSSRPSVVEAINGVPVAADEDRPYQPPSSPPRTQLRQRSTPVASPNAKKTAQIAALPPEQQKALQAKLKGLFGGK